LDQPRPINFFASKPERWTLILGAVLAFVLAGCSSQNFTPPPSPASSYYEPAPTNYANYGGSRTEVASWYGPGFAGHPTSSGETYNPEGLTAASKTLPLGSHVRVTNPDTGRSVVVRINDRGPFVRGRSLDLSHGAAKQIGLTGKGVGRVEVTPTATSTPAASGNIAAYADSNPPPAARHVSYASYAPRLPSTTMRLPHYHYSSHRSYSSRRMVSNPIGSALASIIPRF
jgi:rare lipoprotein A